MTSVNSPTDAAPAPEAMTAETADPPTMKGAGRLSSDYGYDFAGVLAVVAMLAVLVGGMALAIMVSHRRHAAGAVIYGVTGVGALVAMVLAQTAWGYPDDLMGTLIYVGAPLAVGWLLLGAVALVVGSVVRPAGKRHDASAF